MQVMISLTDIKDIAIVDTSGRYKYQGTSVPRVTEIISKMIHEDAIVQWANSLGFQHKRYTEVLNNAAVYGTKVHHTIEVYLKDHMEPSEKIYCFEAFKKWWQTISKDNKVEILGQEQKLVCPFFGGTYDMLLKINDLIYLVDFKTSNHVTYKYYIQLAAYAYMLREYYGIQIHGVIILQLLKRNSSYNEYFLNLKNDEHKKYFALCERTFLSLVYSYYHITYLEKNFTKLKEDKNE